MICARLAVRLGRARAGEVRADLDGYLFARSFMGAIVAFVILQHVLGMDRVHAIDTEAYINNLVETHLRRTFRTSR